MSLGMEKLKAFKESPWRESHKTYRESALAMSPAPEYASSEILLASLYRTIGLGGVKEGDVPSAGRELIQKLEKHDDRKGLPPGATLGSEDWAGILHGVLESPKLPNQSTKRFIQVTPLVPALALFSGAARQAGNPWPAGSLVRRMVCLGSRDHDSAQALWAELFQALGVGEDDDVFARWLEGEARAWSRQVDWKLETIPTEEVAMLHAGDYEKIEFLPARQFTKDLRAIIQAKPAVTRRQWTSMLESILRLASVAHVAWLCDVHARAWRCVADALDGRGPIGTNDARERLFPGQAQYMAYGSKALNGLKEKASNYLAARLGLNMVLWSLQAGGEPYEGSLQSSGGLANLCHHVRQHRVMLAANGIDAALIEAREQEARALNCRKGIGSNLYEFVRYTLGQRPTAIELLKGYDQGYVAKKKGASPSSPSIVSLGPVAVLALVHCALSGMEGPRSINRLGQHLAAYGIAVDRQAMARNDLGNQLRMLGLVLDSPDAESGMLLLPPFPIPKARL